MTQEELLLTFCPPAPPERTNVSSISLSRTPSALIRWSSCASLFGKGGNELIPKAYKYCQWIANRSLPARCPANRQATQVDWQKCFACGCGQADAPVAAVEDCCGGRAARLFDVETANNARFKTR